MTLIALWPAWVRQFKFGLQGFPTGLGLFILVLGWWCYEQRNLSSRQPGSQGFLGIAWLLLVIFAGSFNVIPPLMGQILATIALACSMLAAFPKSRASKRVAYLAILPLTLPLETALQFVLGYPFRRISAELTGILLAPYGIDIKGTTLFYDSYPLEVDAACSGVLGLWAFLIIGAILSLVLRFRLPKLLLSLTMAVLFSIGYNVIRTSLLFMYRFHEGVESATLHSLLGSFAFLLTVIVFGYAVFHQARTRFMFNNEASSS